jgi:hypothetical protein
MNTAMRRSTRHVLLGLSVTAALTMSACGGNGSDSSGDKPSGRETIKSGGESSKAILPAGDLPEGWRYATIGDFLGIPQMCGVVLEPPKLSSAETKRFATRSGDTFVIQYSFVSSDEAATTKRIDEFVAAAATCTKHQPTKTNSATVTPLVVTPVGDAFAAVTAVDDADVNNRREYVVFRNGAHVTVLLSYGLAGRVATPADLAAMAAAVDGRVKAR